MRRDVMVEKLRFVGERCSKDYYMFQKKLELNGFVVVLDGRLKMLQKLSYDGRKDFRDNVIRGEVSFKKFSFIDKNQYLWILRCFEGKEIRYVRFVEGIEIRYVRFFEG